jgi:2Fe-2S ferredoxin
VRSRENLLPASGPQHKLAARDSTGAAEVNVVFKTRSGQVREVRAAVGTTLMEAAVEHGIEGIIGECGGSCACATCHVKFEAAQFERVGPPGEMEINTLYFRARRQPTSRLACQIVLSHSLEGLQAEVATD